MHQDRQQHVKLRRGCLIPVSTDLRPTNGLSFAVASGSDLGRSCGLKRVPEFTKLALGELSRA